MWKLGPGYGFIILLSFDGGSTDEINVSGSISTNRSLNLTINITESLGIGEHTFEIELDGNDEIDELEEKNNEYFGMLNFIAPPTCSDGTIVGECSDEKPKYCIEGVLVNLCSTCECPSEFMCESEGANCIAEGGEYFKFF